MQTPRGAVSGELVDKTKPAAAGTPIAKGAGKRATVPPQSVSDGQGQVEVAPHEVGR